MNAPREKVLRELIRLCKSLDKDPAKYRAELRALRELEGQRHRAELRALRAHDGELEQLRGELEARELEAGRQLEELEARQLEQLEREARA